LIQTKTAHETTSQHVIGRKDTALSRVFFYYD